MDNEQTQYQLVTIEEMRELAKSEDYKDNYAEKEYPLELLRDSKSGLYFTDYFADRGSHLITSHILAEECVAHKDKLDWGRVTDGFNIAILARIIGLYQKPLVWSDVPDSLKEQYIILGQFALEMELKEREDEELISFLLNESREKRAVWFVEHMPTREIPKWDILLSNYHRADLLKGLSDTEYYLDDFDDTVMLLPYFKENISYIKNYCGIDKVEEVIDRLRKDWNRIVKLKLCRFCEFKEEEIQEIHDYIFDEINYQIEVWKIEDDAEDEIEEPIHSEPKTCRYICAEKIVETGVRTVEEYTAQLSDACVNAPTLASFLEQGRRLGYLQFHGEGKSEIYNHLKECFPGKIKFGYPNFTQYFD